MTQSAFIAVRFIPSVAETRCNAQNVAPERTQNVEALQNKMMTLYANFALTGSKFGHLSM